MTMRIAPTARVLNMRDYSEVSCLFCKHTFVVNYAPDMGLSTRVQWLDADIYAHNELDADGLAPQVVRWAEEILAWA
jgi:hypothetical protein